MINTCCKDTYNCSQIKQTWQLSFPTHLVWIRVIVWVIYYQSISFFWLAEKSHQKSLQRILKVNTIHTHVSMRHNKNSTPGKHRHAYILHHIRRHTNIHNKTNCGFPASVDTPPTSTAYTHTQLYIRYTHTHTCTHTHTHTHKNTHTHTRTNTHINTEMHCTKQRSHTHKQTPNWRECGVELMLAYGFIEES